MKSDYTYLRRRTVSVQEVQMLQLDLLVSAYDLSDRVGAVYSAIPSPEKFWLIHPEYEFAAADLVAVPNQIVLDRDASEVEAWLSVWARVLAGRDPGSLSVGVDISGMMRPFITVLPLILSRLGFKEVTVLYSDPLNYTSGIATAFSVGNVDTVRQVAGLEGVHNTSSATADTLIIGAGYDHGLVHAVANFKRSASHLLMLGLPSLQPHMYQESQLNLSRAAEAIRNFSSRSFLHAPANDPFVTAQVLSQRVGKLRRARPDLNIYLSPVGPKAHVLGFGWYMACEELDKATSMIFPYAPSYSTGSATGISRIHLYELELGWVSDPQWPGVSANATLRA